MKTESNERKLFENLVSKEEIASELGISPRTVGNWISSGKLPCIKIGKKNFALRFKLNAWLENKGRNARSNL
ncbi:MAG: helix-turn-helix domain-containing protein [Pseudobacteriovorax sp.]|nr:helix-turn-helix domain-containing protein [Pseudobacteriovorax sp.]